MQSKMSIIQPEKNTLMIDMVSTLNKQVGRNTGIFLMIVKKPKFLALAETKFSMLGRLSVAAEVIMEKI